MTEERDTLEGDSPDPDPVKITPPSFTSSTPASLACKTYEYGTECGFVHMYIKNTTSRKMRVQL
jgi:hypothetical protein